MNTFLSTILMLLMISLNPFKKFAKFVRSLPIKSSVEENVLYSV